MEPFRCPQIALRNPIKYRRIKSFSFTEEREYTGSEMTSLYDDERDWIGLDWREWTGLIKHGPVKCELVKIAKI